MLNQGRQECHILENSVNRDKVLYPPATEAVPLVAPTLHVDLTFIAQIVRAVIKAMPSRLTMTTLITPIV